MARLTIDIYQDFGVYVQHIMSRRCNSAYLARKLLTAMHNRYDGDRFFMRSFDMSRKSERISKG